MARNVPNPTPKSETHNPHAAATAPAVIQGGSSGSPDQAPDENRAATMIGGGRVAAARPEARAQEARRFVVKDGPRRRDSNGNPEHQITVVYDGSVTRIQVGKVYAEHQVDLDLLRRQGVTLEEILPPPSEADPQPEA